jgi:hypothetical protein
VLRTVTKPEHAEPDPRARRPRYYRRWDGPSRWLLVVVSFEQQPGRIITAVATRKDPHGVEAVNVKIGPLVFDHADCDSEGDVLYLNVAPPRTLRERRAPRAMSCASSRAPSASSA